MVIEYRSREVRSFSGKTIGRAYGFHEHSEPIYIGDPEDAKRTQERASFLADRCQTLQDELTKVKAERDALELKMRRAGVK